jgi:hypothetical protein
MYLCLCYRVDEGDHAQDLLLAVHDGHAQQGPSHTFSVQINYLILSQLPVHMHIKKVQTSRDNTGVVCQPTVSNNSKMYIVQGG